jgi:CDP-diacylglycerol--serine O-phosphatidyltransferase
MIRYLNVANLITSASLASGFMALVWAAEGRFEAAAIAIVVAAMLDGLDGLAARIQGTSGRFGSNLDSLTDVVAFGAAPALMLARGPAGDVPVAGIVVCALFLVAGAWRLARFSIVEDRLRWIGLPIPTAGILAAAAVALDMPAWPQLALSLALSLLMVSEISFPTAAGLMHARRRRKARRQAPVPRPPRRNRVRGRVRRRRRREAPPVPVGRAQPRD